MALHWVIERLFYHTELHPFYMNTLCQQLWDQSAVLTVDLVNSAWHYYVKHKKE
jgi:hypothetical protein